jgi:hypothetical protein
MDLNKIRTRIQALLKLANDPKATPHEAATARRIADKLLLQYNLTEEDLNKRPWVNLGDGRVEVNLDDIEMLLKMIRDDKELIESLETEVAADMTLLSMLKTSKDTLKDTLKENSDWYSQELGKARQELEQTKQTHTKEIQTIKNQSAIFVIIAVILVLATIACSLIWPLHGGP